MCTGGWSAGRAQGPFFGVLCCIYGWLYLVRCWGFLLVWLLLYAAADCACCLQSLLLAAGSLRSRLCPDASSALCSVLHTASHLDVSHLKTRSGKPLHPSKSNGLQSKTSKAQTTAPQSPTCHSSRPRHSHSTRCRHLPAGATTRQAHGSQRQLANREVQTRPPPRRNVGA